jgi:hypothetical protein
MRVASAAAINQNLVRRLGGIDLAMKSAVDFVDDPFVQDALCQLFFNLAENNGKLSSFVCVPLTAYCATCDGACAVLERGCFAGNTLLPPPPVPPPVPSRDVQRCTWTSYQPRAPSR